MLFKAIALSLALLVGIGSLVPVINNTIEAKPTYKSKKYKKLKKYSKAWWRWYYKQKRKKRAALARKRALRAKQILLARKKTQPVKRVEVVSTKPNTPKTDVTISKSQPVSNELQFPINDKDGKSVGRVLLSVFGQVNKSDSDSVTNKRIGGVSTSFLRQNVVEKMVKEQGWVVNDFYKNLNGRKVYVVVAQCPSKGKAHSRLFYFTEVEGKIYTISNTCSEESQDRIEQESEKMIRSLQQGSITNLIGLK